MLHVAGSFDHLERTDVDIHEGIRLGVVLVVCIMFRRD